MVIGESEINSQKFKIQFRDKEEMAGYDELPEILRKKLHCPT